MKRKKRDGEESLSAPEEKKPAPIDDGRTVAQMTADWMPWNVGNGDPRQCGREKKKREKRKRPDDRPGEQLTKEEKHAMLRGAFLAHLPVIVGIALIFAVLFVLARIWLMP